MSYPIVPDVQMEKGKPTTVQMSSIMADMKRPFLRVTNRWEYLERYLSWWRGYVKYRLYMVGLAAIGVLLLTKIPVASVFCFGAAAYYWQMHLLCKQRLESKRTVVIGH